MHKHNVKYIAT